MSWLDGTELVAYVIDLRVICPVDFDIWFRRVSAHTCPNKRVEDHLSRRITAEMVLQGLSVARQSVLPG